MLWERCVKWYEMVCVRETNSDTCLSFLSVCIHSCHLVWEFARHPRPLAIKIIQSPTSRVKCPKHHDVDVTTISEFRVVTDWHIQGAKQTRVLHGASEWNYLLCRYRVSIDECPDYGRSRVPSPGFALEFTDSIQMIDGRDHPYSMLRGRQRWPQYWLKMQKFCGRQSRLLYVGMVEAGPRRTRRASRWWPETASISSHLLLDRHLAIIDIRKCSATFAALCAAPNGAIIFSRRWDWKFHITTSCYVWPLLRWRRTHPESVSAVSRLSGCQAYQLQCSAWSSIVTI